LPCLPPWALLLASSHLLESGWAATLLWFCLLEDYHFLGVEILCSSESLSMAVTFRQVQRVFFFYCPCQLAAQGYCQLSVRALILVSHG
jgi:hypothetical protein